MNEFEIAVVNEPSVFEPLKVYCIIILGVLNVKNIYIVYAHATMATSGFGLYVYRNDTTMNALNIIKLNHYFLS